MFSNEITASGKIRWDYEKQRGSTNVSLQPPPLKNMQVCSERA